MKTFLKSIFNLIIKYFKLTKSIILKYKSFYLVVIIIILKNKIINKISKFQNLIYTILNNNIALYLKINSLYKDKHEKMLKHFMFLRNVLIKLKEIIIFTFNLKNYVRLFIYNFKNKLVHSLVSYSIFYLDYYIILKNKLLLQFKIFKFSIFIYTILHKNLKLKIYFKSGDYFSLNFIYLLKNITKFVDIILNSIIYELNNSLLFKLFNIYFKLIFSIFNNLNYNYFNFSFNFAVYNEIKFIKNDTSVIKKLLFFFSDLNIFFKINIIYFYKFKMVFKNYFKVSKLEFDLIFKNIFAYVLSLKVSFLRQIKHLFKNRKSFISKIKKINVNFFSWLDRKNNNYYEFRKKFLAELNYIKWDVYIYLWYFFLDNNRKYYVRRDNVAHIFEAYVWFVTSLDESYINLGLFIDRYTVKYRIFLFFKKINRFRMIKISIYTVSIFKYVNYFKNFLKKFISYKNIVKFFMFLFLVIILFALIVYLLIISYFLLNLIWKLSLYLVYYWFDFINYYYLKIFKSDIYDFLFYFIKVISLFKSLKYLKRKFRIKYHRAVRSKKWKFKSYRRSSVKNKKLLKRKRKVIILIFKTICILFKNLKRKIFK